MRNHEWPGWETVRPLGKGSISQVYEIESHHGETVEKAALKVISVPVKRTEIEDMFVEGYDRADIADFFKSQAESIAASFSWMHKLNGHENILGCDGIRCVPHSDGIGWDVLIKMEQATPLLKTLPEQISVETVTQIAKALCSALVEAQHYGIVHKDIKPQNVYVSQDGTYKLGNFGMADATEKLVSSIQVESYTYMAPEVYRNQPHSKASDIYALGLVLYWLLNERRIPFLPLPPANVNAEMRHEARTKRLAGMRFPLPAHGNDFLKKIVMRACAYSASERYQTAEEMLEDLVPDETIDNFRRG